MFSNKGEILFLTSPSELMRVSLAASHITQPKPSLPTLCKTVPVAAASSSAPAATEVPVDVLTVNVPSETGDSVAAPAQVASVFLKKKHVMFKKQKKCFFFFKTLLKKKILKIFFFFFQE